MKNSGFVGFNNLVASVIILAMSQKKIELLCQFKEKQ